MEFSSKQGLAAAVAAALALWTAQASAEPGFFVGASIGQSTTEAQQNDIFDTGENVEFDEDETGYKIFGGYMFNDYLGVELGYVDLGQPEDKFSDDGGEFDLKLEAEASGFTANLVGEIPLGPVDLFAKVGLISYDAEIEATLIDNFDGEVLASGKADDDGEELMYGVGARLNIGNFGVRAEYEMYDVGEIDDLSMISLGGELRF
jgi:hypothetical protein